MGEFSHGIRELRLIPQAARHLPDGHARRVCGPGSRRARTAAGCQLKQDPIATLTFLALARSTHALEGQRQ
jgi:hypothetical protein